MANIISITILFVSSFAVGIFYFLSFLEKRIWGIMRDPLTSDVRSDNVLEINQTLQSVVDYVPLTMQVVMASLLLLLSTQLWLSSFATIPAAQIIVFTVAALLGIRQVLSSIGELKATESVQQSIDEVRVGVSKVLIVHHSGLFVAVLIGILQFVQLL